MKSIARTTLINKISAETSQKRLRAMLVDAPYMLDGKYLVNASGNNLNFGLIYDGDVLEYVPHQVSLDGWGFVLVRVGQNYFIKYFHNGKFLKSNDKFYPVSARGVLILGRLSGYRLARESRIIAPPDEALTVFQYREAKNNPRVSLLRIAETTV